MRDVSTSRVGNFLPSARQHRFAKDCERPCELARFPSPSPPKPHRRQTLRRGRIARICAAAYVFCMRSMASGGAFHCAFPHASQQAFLEAHERAFAYFGGVFKKLRYDNLKSAVKKILRGHQREETTRFIAFRSHWDFESEFCTPAEGHEKGGVEGEGGYFRRNHMVPVPNVASWEELDALLLRFSKEDEPRIIGERTQTVGAGMLLEREHLKGLKEGFDLAAIHYPKVNASGCVKVLTNFYSTPLPVGIEVQAKVQAAFVEIASREMRGAARTLLPAAAESPQLGALLGSSDEEAWSFGGLNAARAVAGTGALAG